MAPDGEAKDSHFYLGMQPGDSLLGLSDKTSFLSVAWTMTDYDGTTQ